MAEQNKEEHRGQRGRKDLQIKQKQGNFELTD